MRAVPVLLTVFILAWQVDWSTAFSAESATYSVHRTNSTITLARPDGKPILRYVTGPLPKSEQPQTTVPAVGYLHPVYTPSGQVLTESGHAGGDHTWLRGVFLAWPQVRGEKPAGFWTCGQAVWKEKGHVVNREVTATADAAGGQLTATNAWTDGQIEVLKERAWLAARLVSGVHVVDLRCELSAFGTKDVQLLPWAFAGLAFHARRVADETVSFHSPEGEVKRSPPRWNNPERNWPPAAWYDLLLTTKQDTACGAAMMAHLANGTSTWQAYYALRMLNPNANATHPITVKPNKPLILRYRLVIHDGCPPVDILDQLATEFQKN